MIREINDADYKEAIANNTLVLLYFSAEWCGPCKKIAPEIERIAFQRKEELVVFKAYADTTTEEMFLEYKVRNVPTFILIEDSIVLDKYVGADSTALMRMINARKTLL